MNTSASVATSVAPDEISLPIFLVTAPVLWFFLLRPFFPLIRRAFTRDFWLGEDPHCERLAGSR